MKSIQSFHLMHKRAYNTICLCISIATAFLLWTIVNRSL
jgi:hypothetical protein